MMLKKLLLLCTGMLMSTSVFAYTPDTKDKIIIVKLTSAIEEIIEQQGEKIRWPVIRTLKNLGHSETYKDNERVVFILTNVTKRVNSKLLPCLGSPSPVCGQKNGKQEEYPGMCTLEDDNAELLYAGACGFPEDTELKRFSISLRSEDQEKQVFSSNESITLSIGAIGEGPIHMLVYTGTIVIELWGEDGIVAQQLPSEGIYAFLKEDYGWKTFDDVLLIEQEGEYKMKVYEKDNEVLIGEQIFHVCEDGDCSFQ